MAQFDVHRNPGRAIGRIPYLVTLQSGRFDRASTRLVGPLVLPGRQRPEPHSLMPAFRIEGREVFLDVFNLATVLAARLGDPVGSLADEESRTKLIRALDELVSHA